MKEHKNHKVRSEGILWMVSAVEDFGVSHLKLKDLIDFVKEIGLQSSAAATRNASIKLLGVLHKFVVPDIKGFLTDVKPALLSALDTEYEKNPFESLWPELVPNMQSSIQNSHLLRPFQFNYNLNTPAHKYMRSLHVKPALLSALDTEYEKNPFEGASTMPRKLSGHQIRPHPWWLVGWIACIVKILVERGRLNDSNKNQVMATLTKIGNVASAMHHAVEKSSKGILKCLGDNRKHMRVCVLNTLDSLLCCCSS
ncbi:unnamed protein product [Trifolium pratense]|uniref:Uncharacterized protein n=1 Tax=Trifolium pratense TaxID=57577 RepID=A0ACB0MF85_TRIPR|nr:unnamed protein product [Trifolium pratense]